MGLGGVHSSKLENGAPYSPFWEMLTFTWGCSMPDNCVLEALAEFWIWVGQRLNSKKLLLKFQTSTSNGPETF